MRNLLQLNRSFKSKIKMSKNAISFSATLLFGLFSNFLIAQTFNYGTGSIASNTAPFNSLGGTGITVSGNDITVTANVNMVSGIYNFANFTINSGVTVTVTGNAGPLIIRCTGNFVNNGELRAVSGAGGNASGVTGGAAGIAVAGGVNGGVGGAGGGNGTSTTAAGLNFFSATARGLQGCAPTPVRPAWAGPGGGGGGYGTAGTNGGNGSGGSSGCTTGGVGGTATYGNAALTVNVGASATYQSLGATAAGNRWLLAGCSGAGGHGTQSILASARAAGGGGGASGGAIQIAANNVTIGTGAWIRCRGGNGGNGSVSTGANAGGGGGGGGAGGTINIQYFTSYTNTGNAPQVTGGIGGAQGFGSTGSGGAGGNGGSGRVLIEQDIVLCTAPSTQANSFSFSNVTTSSVDISFNRGNGDGGVLVVARASAAPAAPTGGTSYTANSVFGSGSTTAAGSYVVYNSNAAGPVTFNVSGLTAGTTYQFGIYEYNATGTCYLNPGLTGSVAIPVCLPPSTQASAASVTPAVNSATLNYTPGSGTGGQLVVVRQGAAVSADPVQTTSYSANSTFGSGTALGGGFVVHSNTGGSVNISNLIENTTYHYAIYSFNTSGPCYTLPALTGSFTTLNGPMSYVSSTNVQQTGNSPLGSTNQPILRFEVVGGPGTAPALTVSGITFNTTGTTNTSDLTGARIYYTGASTTFSATTQFGTQVNNPSGSHVVSGSQTLLPGSNYFWLVYDVSIGATAGTFIDGQITSVNVGSAQTPTVTDPVGNRTITSLMSLSCGYSFANFAPTWVSNVTDPGRTIIASGAAAIDDQRWPGQSFTSGFSFEFNGTVYNSFGISSKGFIWFGATNPSGLSFTPISSTLAFEGAIAPFAFDMVAHNASTTTPQVTIRYTGTAPNRVCIIEWTAFKPWNNTGGFCPGFGSPTDWNRYDFQLHLYENGGTNSNRIEFVYRDMNGFCVNANGASAQVGLRGTSNTDFLNRQGSGNNAHTASSAGTLNTQVISHGANNFFNGNGGMRFTPTFQRPLVSPSPTASNICPALTANLTTTSPVVTKQWYKDNLPILGATASSYAAPANGNYILVVTQSGCSKVSEITSVTINSCGPIAQTVTGGNNCYSTTVGLAGSEIDATYQLLRDAIPVGSPIAGTGGPIFFGVQTIPGIYTVEGTDLQPLTTTMSGSARVWENPTPAITGTLVNCTSTTLSSSTSVAGNGGSITSRQWQLNGSDLIGENAVTLLANTSGNYTITLTNNQGCEATSSIAAVTINLPPNASVSGTAPHAISCQNGTVTVTTASATNAASLLWTVFSGSGTITPGTETTLNPVYNCVAADAGTTVTLRLTATGFSPCGTDIANFQIEVKPNPVTALTGGPAAICNDINGVSRQLSVTNVEGGTTYLWSPFSDLYVDPTFSTPYTGQNVTTVYSVPFGDVSYTVTATNDLSLCTTAPSTPIALTVCPALTNSICDADLAPNVPVVTNGSWTSYSLLGSTPSAGFPCSPIVRDIYYRVVVPATGELHVTTATGTNPNANLNVQNSLVSIHWGGGTCTTSPSVACNSGGAAGGHSYVFATGLTPGTFAYIRLASTTAPNQNTATFIRMNVSSGLTWTGTSSTAFTNPSNYLGGDGTSLTVPDANKTVLLRAATNAPLVSTSEQVRGLQMITGATLNINTGATLSVSRQVITANNTIAGNGWLVLNGTTAQTLANSAFIHRLRINNASGVSLTAPLRVGALDLQNGLFATSNNLTINSSASLTGYINNFSPGYTGSITGNVNVERRVIGPGAAFHYLSAPVATTITTSQNYNDDFPVVGSPLNYVYNLDPTLTQPTTFPNTWYFEESLTGPYTPGWINARNVVINKAQGFAANINGTLVIDIQGPVNNGPMTYPITVTDDGFNLIGNPYPSPISFNSFRSLASNASKIQNVLYIWNPSINNYATYNGSIWANNNPTPTASSNPLASDVIAHSQSFFVVADNAGNLDFDNSIRTTNQAFTFFNETTKHFTIAVESNGKKDETVITADFNASAAFDRDFDAPKLLINMEKTLNVFTLSENNRSLAINTLGAFEGTVPLQIINHMEGLINISLPQNQSVKLNQNIYLEDKTTGAFINLNEKSYKVYMSEGNSGERFFIHFAKPELATNLVESAMVYSDGSDIVINNSNQSMNVEIFDASGKLVKNTIHAKSGRNTIDCSELNTGIYFVKTNNNFEMKTTKVYIQSRD